MWPSASSPPSRTAGRFFPAAWRNPWAAYIVAAGCLTGLTAVFILRIFGAGYLFLLVVPILVALWFLFRADTLLLVLIFCFVGAASPYLNFAGTMDVARWLLLAAATYYLVIQLLLQGKPVALRAEHTPALFFCTWALATTLISSNPQLTALKAGVFAVLLVFCLLYAERFPNNPQASTESFLKSLVVIGAGVIPLSMALRWTGGELHRYTLYLSSPDAMYGIFGNPNSLGLFSAFLLPVLLWTLRKNPARKVPLGLLTAATLFCLLNSRSRASIAAAFVGLCFYLLLRRPKILFLCFVAGAMVGALYLAYAPEELADLSATYLYKQRESVLVSRLDHWERSLGYIQERWLWGYGFAVSPGMPQDWSLSFTSWAVHRPRGSSLLVVWEETGIVGLLLLLFFPAWVGFRSLRYLAAARHSKDPAFARILALTAAVLVGTVNLLFEDWLVSPGFFATVFFWILLFLLARELRTQEQARQPSLHPGPPRLPTSR